MPNTTELDKRVKRLEKLICCLDKEVQFFDFEADFPVEGVINNIYVDNSTGAIYIWDGVEYVTYTAQVVFVANAAALPAPLIVDTIYVEQDTGVITIYNGVDTFTYSPDVEPDIVSTRVEGTVFLSGGYFAAAGSVYNVGSYTMNDTLASLSLLPTTEPYTELGYDVTETSTTLFGDTDIVDWVLLELRDKDNPKILRYSKPGVVDINGVIRDASDNVSGILFENIVNDNYYVSIKHRNHFGVMSATAQPLSNDANFGSPGYALWEQDDVNYTFLDNNEIRLLTTGKYMVAGFTAISGQYSPYTEIWRAYNALAYGYLPADFNLDGSIDLIEHSFWENFKLDSVGSLLEDNKAIDYIYDTDERNNEGIIVEKIPELHKGWLKQIINNDAFGGLQVPLYRGTPTYVWAAGTMVYDTDNNVLLLSDGLAWKTVTVA